MHRRTLLAAPLVLALPARATPRHDISELRLGAPDPHAAAKTLRRHTTIPTRPIPLAGPALVNALDAGHLEAALLDPATLAMAQIRMGPRLTIIAGPLVTRTALAAALRADIANALA